jgi:hypothetical protein
MASQLDFNQEDMSSGKPIVWIVNYAGHDYEDAKRYGELRNITVGYVSLHSLDRVKFDLTSKVWRETKASDWLLLSGKPLVCVLVALAWFSIHGQVKLLVWDQKKKEKYREMIITTSNINEIFTVLNKEEFVVTLKTS